MGSLRRDGHGKATGCLPLCAIRDVLRRMPKANVPLTRREDFEGMNRIYAERFPDGKHPARTTAIVYSLPRPNFLLEIECAAVLA